MLAVIVALILGIGLVIWGEDDAVEVVRPENWLPEPSEGATAA